VRILVLGDAEDVRGFALAGVEGRVAEDAETARAVLERGDGEGRPVGLLLLSERIARLLPREVDRLVRSERPPAVLVLPGPRA
jgi:vacuolar-type H+-ATPase subunit F/Vma7